MKQHLKKLLLLLIICTSLVTGAFSTAKLHATEHAKNLKKVGDIKSDDYTLIYSDESIKLYYTNITCSGDNSLKLKIENLTNHPLKLTYKLWDVSTVSRSISLSASQILEGVCAPEYNNLLVEKIPEGSSTSNMNIVVNYLQN